MKYCQMDGITFTLLAKFALILCQVYNRIGITLCVKCRCPILFLSVCQKITNPGSMMLIM